MEENIVDLKSVFTTLPGSNVLTLPNPPLFTIVAVSNDYLKATNRAEAELIGKGLFEVFPNDPSDPHLTSEKTVRASLEYALRHKEPHYLPMQRYDVIMNDDTYVERYWSANNKPVINRSGEVVYLIHHIEDVTEKVKAEQKAGQLKGIEKAFGLFMHAPMVVGLLTGDNHIVELANDAALKLWGRTSDVIGKPLLQEIPELAGQGIIELFDEVKRSGQPYFAKEVPVTSLANGKEEVHYFNVVYQPYIDDDSNTTTGVFTLSFDVTEMVVAKKEMEEGRAASERQRRLYETINRSIPDLIYVFDLNYRFTYANKALLEMWGKTWEQAIGKRLLENGYEPWHAEMHEKEIDEVVATKQPIRGEVSFPHATLGKRVYDYIFVPVLNNHGEIEAVAGTTRDITEIKLAEQTIRESEERFRKLADESPMFVFIIDLDPTAPVSYWNKTWLEFTGQSLEAAIGRAWNGILHPDDIAVVMQHYMPAFNNKQPYFIPAARVRRYDGEYFWYAFKGNPRFSPQGEFNGYVGVGFDINSQKLAEEALKQSEAQLQIKVSERTAELESTVEELKRSNTNLEEFAYAASHDLKEPIRKIHTFSERLKQKLQGRLLDDERHLLERMEKATERMQLLVDDLLEYSHASNSPQNFEEINLNKKVALVMDDLEVQIAENNIKVTVGLLPVIKGHRRQIQQLFQNLITNAIKFRRTDVTPEIYISAAVVSEKDLMMSYPDAHPESKLYNRIEISDNGIGFEQQYADRIFRMFQRLHGKAEYEGTGIGLAIVKKVIENHKGFIRAESKPGEGATFKIFLPVL